MLGWGPLTPVRGRVTRMQGRRDAATAQERPGLQAASQSWRKPRKGPPLGPPEAVQPCPHLAWGILSFGAERESISVVFSH